MNRRMHLAASVLITPLGCIGAKAATFPVNTTADTGGWRRRSAVAKRVRVGLSSIERGNRDPFPCPES